MDIYEPEVPQLYEDEYPQLHAFQHDLRDTLEKLAGDDYRPMRQHFLLNVLDTLLDEVEGCLEALIDATEPHNGPYYNAHRILTHLQKFHEELEDSRKEMER